MPVCVCLFCPRASQLLAIVESLQTKGRSVPAHAAELLLLNLVCRQLSLCWSKVGTMTTLLPVDQWELRLCTREELNAAIAVPAVPKHAKATVTSIGALFALPDRSSDMQLGALAGPATEGARGLQRIAAPCDANNSSVEQRAVHDLKLAHALLDVIRTDPTLSWRAADGCAIVDVVSGGKTLLTCALPFIRHVVTAECELPNWLARVDTSTIAFGPLAAGDSLVTTRASMNDGVIRAAASPFQRSASISLVDPTSTGCSVPVALLWCIAKLAVETTISPPGYQTRRRGGAATGTQPASDWTEKALQQPVMKEVWTVCVCLVSTLACCCAF